MCYEIEKKKEGRNEFLNGISREVRRKGGRGER
jgi:hypothetical protein